MLRCNPCSIYAHPLTVRVNDHRYVMPMATSDHAPSPVLGGIILGIAAILALIVANSPLVALYQQILALPGTVRFGSLAIEKPLILWINDGVMALFFVLIGLEIKRELLIGELAGWQRAVLPVIAALGGFLVPALIFTAINWQSGVALKAWAVPTATDIAFVVGIVALLGKAVPISLRVFVVALAIIDDLMAIIVIALFYTANLSMASLVWAAFFWPH